MGGSLSRVYRQSGRDWFLERHHFSVDEFFFSVAWYTGDLCRDDLSPASCIVDKGIVLIVALKHHSERTPPAANLRPGTKGVGTSHTHTQHAMLPTSRSVSCPMPSLVGSSGQMHRRSNRSVGCHLESPTSSTQVWASNFVLLWLWMWLEHIDRLH